MIGQYVMYEGKIYEIEGTFIDFFGKEAYYLCCEEDGSSVIAEIDCVDFF